jgi:transposase
LVKAFEKEMYHRRVATEKPWLSQKHKDDRLAWAEEHVGWSDEQWDSIIWSDEMSIRTGGGQVFVTRRAEEKYLPECCIAKFRGYSSWMV